MSNSFNVVLTGELLKGQSIMQAANSLSRLFKIAPIQAQQMLARAPLVIKKNLQEDTALRFVQAMYKSGFGAAVEEQKPVKTSFAHSFAGHYDDEDEEEAAVTRITPVLVEQSRLAESLDTELTIPTASAESQKAPLPHQEQDLLQAAAVTPLTTTAEAASLLSGEADEDAAVLMSSLSVDGKDAAVEPPQAVETAVAASLEVEWLDAAPPVMALFSAEAEAEQNVTETAIVGSPIEIESLSPVSSAELAHCDTQAHEYSAEQVAALEPVGVYEVEEVAAEPFELAAQADIALQDTQNTEPQLLAPMIEVDDALDPHTAEQESFEADAVVAISEAAEPESVEGAQQPEAALDTEIKSAELVVADAQLNDQQVAEVQWLEPVAQWQTVAELADDLNQVQEFAAIDETALQQMPVAALAEQADWSVQTAAADHFGVPPSDVSARDLAFSGADEPLPDEPPQAHTDWEDAVEISPALSERLAQIAEASKQVSEDATQGPAETTQPEINDTPEGVLLFEAADVTEISSADWDDWHASDAVTDASRTTFNPLLDFDQVVPDWHNRSVELVFDSPVEIHHSGVTAADEQELAAFLGAADDESDTPHTLPGTSSLPAADALGAEELTPSADEAVGDEQAILAAAGAHPTADSAWAHEISVQANCGFLEVVIPKGKELHVAAAAAVTMGLSLHEQLNAGSSVRAWLLAKGFVINTYEAVESAGTVGITAITHGMVCAIDASDFPVMVQQSAYLASTDDVQLNADQSRLNPVVSASKWIHCSGSGELWLNAQGLWEMVEVDGCYRINSRYLMAYSKSLELKAPPLAGLKSYLTSGNGVECRLTGRGVVWVQTEASRAPVIWQ